jgi:hypothetical protein
LFRSASVLALVMGTGWSATARAEPPAVLFEDGADLLAQARELWAEGTAAFNKGQLERARLLYLSAWRAQHHWQIAGSLGHVEMTLGRYRDAAEHLTIYLRESRDVPNVDPRDRALLAGEIARARAKIGAVTVTAEPAGAEVIVDGATVGKAPLADPVFVEPGRHVIEARLERYQSAAEARELTPGGAAEVRLELAAEPKPEAPRLVPVVQQATPPAPPLRYQVNKGLVYGGAALSAVALGVGIGLTAMSNSAASERDGFRAGCNSGDHGGCSQFDSSDQRRWLTGNAAAYTFIGAGAVALATATYALVVPRIKRSPKVTGTSARGVTAMGLGFSW